MCFITNYLIPIFSEADYDPYQWLREQIPHLKKLQNNHSTILLSDFPDETYIILSACPAKLRGSAHICAQQIEQQRIRLTAYIVDFLKTGIDRKEFNSVPIDATTGLIVAMVNGLLRRRNLKLDEIPNLKETTVEFCRRSLLHS